MAGDSCAKMMNRRIPGLRFSTGIDGGKLSHDQAHLDSLDDLDLLHRFVTVRFYLEAVRAATEILSDRSIKCPVLMVHGDQDEVTSREAAEEFFNRLASAVENLQGISRAPARAAQRNRSQQRS